MKIGVSAYSFSQYINEGKMTLIDTIAKAKEMGFESISFIDGFGKDYDEKIKIAGQIKDEAKKVGIEVLAYEIGANFACKKENLADEIKRVKDNVDIASAMGAKLLRHDVMFNYNDFKTFDAALSQMAKAINEVCDYAKEKGIKTMTENHGQICQDPDRIEKIYNAVNNENFGILTDMGNFMCADVYPPQAISRLAHLALLVHTKDFVKHDFGTAPVKEGLYETRGMNYLEGTSVGYGDAHVEQCVAILKKAGYDGTLEIEYEGCFDCVEGIKRGYDFLKAIVK